jgi:xanthine dehydrogenase YagR molybdenum-binding subunit
MSQEPRPLGRAVDRVDGPAKVTGQAKYAAEFPRAGLLHGWVVSSAIAKGRIFSIDVQAALAVAGVLHVFTHENRPSLPWFDNKYKDDDAPPGSPLRPLYDAKIVHADQPIALVVAETLEGARHAAGLVRVSYEREEPHTNLRIERAHAYVPKKKRENFEAPKSRGKPDDALKDAAVRVQGDYFSPTEHHNPMEMHASTVLYEADGTLTIYDKTQGAQNSQRYVRQVFGLQAGDVRVLSPFVGGAFGSGLRPQYQLYLAVMAAKELKRSVRVALTRQQMFSFGHRPETLQTVSLGASREGKLEAIVHEAIAETSRFEDYIENVVNWSGMMYQCDNVQLEHKLAQLDVYTPLDMRAPGATLGMFGLESAMDELAYALRMDPIELRRRNYASRDQFHDKPFSSNELLACYEQGAARFGWSSRSPEPRSMRVGKRLKGMGMATGVWEAKQMPARARARLSLDGKLTVWTATADIGTGTYTVMSQIAADALGLTVERVDFQLGDSSLPMAPLEGGSFTVSSVGSAVHAVCEKIRKRLFKLATSMKRSPLAGLGIEQVEFANGCIRALGNHTLSVSFAEAMRAEDVLHLEDEISSIPNLAKQKKYTRCTHSAVFVEVSVDEELGTLSVERVVSAVAAGRVLNPKTARSQVLGGVVWGIGMALHEQTHLDHRLGRYVNHNLAEYHVPVNADVRDIDVIFVPEQDDIVNPLGAKGIGEIGIVGVAAAIANAVFHATGKRIRDLPITLDKLL